MGRLGRITEHRRAVRVFATGLAVLLLLGTLAGGAWALVIAYNKKVDVAATYTVTLTPTQTQADEGGASWRVGQATLSESCSAEYVSGLIHITQVGTITNHGPGPIGIVSESGIVWLEEGQTTGGGGETVNVENYPGPVGGTETIGILKEGGPSAIGSWATSARVTADGTAICVLSLHVQG